MENPKNVKRSIRIPKETNKQLQEIAVGYGISTNKLILKIVEEWLNGRR